jgi:hypothetical protein
LPRFSEFPSTAEKQGVVDWKGETWKEPKAFQRNPFFSRFPSPAAGKKKSDE